MRRDSTFRKRECVQIASGVLIVAAAALFLLSGCRTMGDVLQEKAEGGGTTKVYPVAADRAWTIAMTVLHWEGSGPIEEHRAENYMLTNASTSGVLGDAVIGAWIESIDDHQTSVTVVTKRVNALDLTTSLTESTFHRRFGQAVEIVNSGRPLPLVPPLLPRETDPTEN